MNRQQDLSTYLLIIAMLLLPVAVFVESKYPEVWFAPIIGVQADKNVVQCIGKNIAVLGDDKNGHKTIELSPSSRACNLHPTE